jgi:hypothetical protein
MGRASELAAELNAMETANEAARKAAMDANLLIANHADDLWSMTAAATIDGIKELASASQVVRDAYLSCTQLDPNFLSISSKVIPLLRLEIRYIPKQRISYRVVAEQFTACSLPKSGIQGDFRFTVDRRLHPYFTDGVSFLVPQYVADKLIDIVGDFFKRAQEYPSILS